MKEKKRESLLLGQGLKARILFIVNSQGYTYREPPEQVHRAAERRRFYRVSKETDQKSSPGIGKGPEGRSQDHRKRPRSREYRMNIVNAEIPQDSSFKLLCSTGHPSRMKRSLDAPHLTKQRSLPQPSRGVDVTIDLYDASIIEIDNRTINNQETEDGEILD
ncbi:hypothetical protein Aduo_003782 [Ancylostoma duodenale]